MSSKSIIEYISISKKWTHAHTHGREPSPSLPFNHYHRNYPQDKCLFLLLLHHQEHHHDHQPRKKATLAAQPTRQTGRREVIVKCV